jgi:hypothetical protein
MRSPVRRARVPPGGRADGTRSFRLLAPVEVPCESRGGPREERGERGERDECLHLHGRHLL